MKRKSQPRQQIVYIPINGTFSKTDLAKVDFKVNNPRDENLYDDLKSIGIAVSFSGKNYNKVVEIRQSPLVVKPTSTSADLDQLYDSLEEFRKKRTIGKGLQLAGVLAVGASIFLSQSSEPDADMIKGLSIGGAALSGIGFIVDLDAGRHLKLKRTP